MSNLTSEVKTLLSTVSNVYRGSYPATPDAVVCLYASGGYGRSLTGTQVEQPTFQVRVRAATYDAALTLCDTVKDLLHGHNTTKLLLIEQQGDTLELGRDTNERPEFSMNFRTFYRR